MTAGSKPILFASRGSVQPTIFANKTVVINVRQTTSAMVIETSARLKTNNFTKFAAASVTPQRKATRSSFHIIRKISRNSISPSEIPRMTVTELWAASVAGSIHKHGNKSCKNQYLAQCVFIGLNNVCCKSSGNH